METQCDLSTVMKVSGNLSHMSGDHLHTQASAWRWADSFIELTVDTETMSLFPFRLADILKLPQGRADAKTQLKP